MAWPLPVVKIQPTREKNQSALCMRFCVNYVPACLHVHTVCVQVYTRLCMYSKCVCVLACARECVFLYISLETCDREWRSVEDGNKIKLFIGLEWEQVARATLCPFPIYFSVGVWECWTRLNRLALKKQYKINTGDWGYNNTQQPLLLSDSTL